MTIPGFPPFVPPDTAQYIADEAVGKTPFECYEFHSEGTFWRYTSSEKQVTVNGDVFDPEPVIRQGVEQGTDFSGEQLDVQLGEHTAIVDAYRSAPYGVPFHLRVYREHMGALTPGVVAIFEGEVADVKVAEGVATFTVNNAAQLVNRTIPRYTHQSLCNHQLYGSLCKAVRATYEVTDTVVDVGVADLMWVEFADVAVKPADYYTGGVMTWVDPNGLTRKRFIMRDDVPNSRVYLLSPFPFAFAIGDSIEVVPGCDRQYATCRDKFANTQNFGGFPWSKTRDPRKGVV
jgi:uncharacterized phage protein (TIGR02218 family)